MCSFFTLRSFYIFLFVNVLAALSVSTRYLEKMTMNYILLSVHLIQKMQQNILQNLLVVPESAIIEPINRSTHQINLSIAIKL